MTKPKENNKDLKHTKRPAPAPFGGPALKTLYALTGKEILDRISAQNRPKKWVQSLSQEDFFWLVKKVGIEDCLPLLELASETQRQFLLDVELWRKDRLHLEATSLWLKRLQQADVKGLVKWLFGRGQDLAYLYFFKRIQVAIMGEETAGDVKAGFFTLDGVFYVNVVDEADRETVVNILHELAREDLAQYQSFLLGLSGVIPAEREEEMLRLRNVRLAEHGFLPKEEALAVYSPLAPETLSPASGHRKADLMSDKGNKALTPLTPFHCAADQNTLLSMAFSRISNRGFLDRIRFEFAGLCNLVLSADGIMGPDFEALIKTCRKTAGYVNLALESLCGTDIALAERLLKGNFLESVFRVGVGLALSLKWEAERWLKKSWFFARGIDFAFWGDDWGEILAGMVQKRPRLFRGYEQGGSLKDFEHFSELEGCRKILHRLMLLDTVLERLTARYPLDEKAFQHGHVTFQTLFFNLWAREILKLEPCFSQISLAQAQQFFGRLRVKDTAMPYAMPGMKERFFAHFVKDSDDLEPQAEAVLTETLAIVWNEFREEYARVEIGDLDGRFSRFLWIASAPRA